MKGKTLYVIDEIAVPVCAALTAVRDAGGASIEEENVLVLTQCDSLGGKLPVESGSLDVVVSVHRAAPDLVGQQWLEEIGRVLKPGGKILLHASLAATENKLQSTLERKLLLAGFLEVQALEDTQSLAITGKKASWKAGSSFALKKATKTIPKLQIDDDSELIDEDSLLTEEDLKKPQLPLVGDCEVGSTRKACKNCTCGRAEEEEKVLKLGLTTEQIYNPKSACGSGTGYHQDDSLSGSSLASSWPLGYTKGSEGKELPFSGHRQDYLESHSLEGHIQADFGFDENKISRD